MATAYATPGGIHRDGNVVYVAGTRPGLTKDFASDAIDDLMLPLGLVTHTTRYRDLAKVARPGDVLVGHSLGGAVVDQYAREHGNKYRVYGAPLVSWRKNPNHVSNGLDPIAMFDRGAVHASMYPSHSSYSYEPPP
jgi:hypothetical protein